MKSIRRLAAATASGALLTMGAFIGIEALRPANSSAGETWVLIHKERRGIRPNGIRLMGWIDVRSIVRSGDLVYYVTDFSLIGKDGKPKSQPKSRPATAANCRTQRLIGNDGSSPSFGDDWQGLPDQPIRLFVEAARFACSF